MLLVFFYIFIISKITISSLLSTLHPHILYTYINTSLYSRDLLVTYIERYNNIFKQEDYQKILAQYDECFLSFDNLKIFCSNTMLISV